MSQTNKRNHAILKAQEILSNPEKYIIVDTETSGLGDRAEVLEICAMSLQKEVLLEHFFTPTGTISDQAIATHGLTKEVLQQKGATTWETCASEINEAFAGKVMLAYNSSFDQKMIVQTATLYGFDSPIDETFCIMRLRQQFAGTKNTEKLGGDHTAKGDCIKTLDLLHEIANAELEEDSDSIEIKNNDELINICLELEEISAQRLALKKKEDAIKEICGIYLKDINIENISLKNGRQVERVDSIAKVKSNIPLEQLPDSFKKTSVDHYAVKRLWKRGELDEELFSYEETHSIKIKNQ